MTGSTISVKKSGKPTLKKNESNSNKSLGVKLGETYEEKVKKREQKHDVDEVKYLTVLSMYLCMYVCMYVCMFVCTYIHRNSIS